MISVNKNIKILFKYLIVPVLAGWLFYSLYRQVSRQPNLAGSWALIKSIPFGNHAWMFWLAVFLSFVNIGLEGVKWQFLMKPLEKMPYFRALGSVLSGMTLSINTPNRIGEYGGRMLYISRGKKLKSISLSITGSISQLIITLFLGCIALTCLLYFIIPEADNIMGLNRFWARTLLIIAVLVSIGVLLFYFRISWLTQSIQNWKAAKHIVPFIQSLQSFTNKALLEVLGISLLRYIIFTTQYVLLIKASGIQIPLATIIILIATLFLVMAVVPSFAIADLGIRGQFSIALFGLFTANTLGILTSVFVVWLLNIFLPAFVGSLVIVTTKVFRKGIVNW